MRETGPVSKSDMEVSDSSDKPRAAAWTGADERVGAVGEFENGCEDGAVSEEVFLSATTNQVVTAMAPRERLTQKRRVFFIRIWKQKYLF